MGDENPMDHNRLAAVKIGHALRSIEQDLTDDGPVQLHRPVEEKCERCGLGQAQRYRCLQERGTYWSCSIL